MGRCGRLSLRLASVAVAVALALASRLAKASDAEPFSASPSAPEPPVVRGARYVPASAEGAVVLGYEPGGGARVLLAGVRAVWGPGERVAVADDRLPGVAALAVAAPERLGGAFVFTAGARLWRAETWLGPARPWVTAPWPVAEVSAGLDRLYLRSSQGAMIAVDPLSGDREDLGPLPASPRHGRILALDGWREAAIADWRGVVVTSDAGSSWHPVPLPIEPRDLVASGDGFLVGGLDAQRRALWWTVRADGQATWSGPSWPVAERPGGAARERGASALAAAVEDGWPLSDGTAMVARDGQVSRVRLADGVPVQALPGAFPADPARCHAISLAQPADRTAFGFVCGEPRGKTLLYRWDGLHGRLVLLRAFPEPRQVLAPGNGTLAVRGACETEPGAAPDEATYCTMALDGTWRQVQLGEEGARPARLVPMPGGRVALVEPPLDADLSTAELVLLDGARATRVPLAWPALEADARAVLARGTWLDGFEERRPGVLGGWIDAAGSVLGLEVALDGTVRVGEYIEDAGRPIVAGRWAFGWTASRRGFESIDGGMTWSKDVEVPDPLASPATVRERACGPVGCVAAGWLRVGWQAGAPVPAPDTPVLRLATGRPAPALLLECEPVEGPAPASPAASAARPPGSADRPRSASGERTWGTLTVLPGFGGVPGPALPHDSVGVSAEATGGPERALRSVATGRVYAWGPPSGDWSSLGRWQVRWQWPWGGWTDARSSRVAEAPWPTVEVARREVGAGIGAMTTWTLIAGDDADHALLVGRRTFGGSTAAVMTLEAGRPPRVIARAGGEPFPEVESAIRAGGRWYVATVQGAAELPATVLYALDGRVAREIARVPRVGAEVRLPVRLARRSDGRAVGLVAEGEPNGDRGARLWLLPVDLESDRPGDPQALAAADLADVSSPCTGDDAGWELDLPSTSAVSLRIGPAWESDLRAPLLRVRMSAERTCLGAVAGSVDGYASTAPAALSGDGHPASTPPGPARSVPASVFSAGARHALRCWRR
jgi:hypothetical protein